MKFKINIKRSRGVYIKGRDESAYKLYSREESYIENLIKILKYLKSDDDKRSIIMTESEIRYDTFGESLLIVL